jgi:ferredoxin-type protein NapF
MRRAVQGAAFALFLFLIAITRYPFTEWVPVDLFLVLDPLLALVTSLAARTQAPGWGLALLVLLLTGLLGRFFCGWLCPLGTCLDLTEAAVFRGRKRRRPADALVARNLKLYVLAFLLAAAAADPSLVYLLDPIAFATRLFTYVLAPLAALAANFGLAAVRPAAERLDWYGLARTAFEPGLLSSAAALTLAAFAGVVLLSAIQPRFWCRSVCPLGGLFSLAARFPVFRRRVSAACDHGGVCAAVCETGAIPRGREEVTRPGECILCLKCVTKCRPRAARFAIGGGTGQGTDPGRRLVLASAAGGIVSALFLDLSPRQAVRDERAVRPPGALPEEEFLKTCVRCGQCVKACPTHTLAPAIGPGGAGGFLAPVHRMRLAGCDQDCTLCGQVCPTQAIRDLDEDEKRHAKIGSAVILRDRCLVWRAGKACLVCDEACPYDAIHWQTEGATRRPYVDEDHCNGCGICESVCPVLGDSAIVVGPHGEIRLPAGSYVEEARARGLMLKRKGDADRDA